MTDDDKALVQELYSGLVLDRLAGGIITKTADRIEALSAENERLKGEVLLQMGWKTEAQNEADTLAADLNHALGDNSRLREALCEIADRSPVTCDMTLAHEMADIARAALGETE